MATAYPQHSTATPGEYGALPTHLYELTLAALSLEVHPLPACRDYFLKELNQLPMKYQALRQPPASPLDLSPKAPCRFNWKPGSAAQKLGAPKLKEPQNNKP